MFFRAGSMVRAVVVALACFLFGHQVHAQTCPVGNLTVSGVVNTYWAGTGTLAAGATTLTLGTQRTGTDAVTGLAAVTTNFAIGDLMLIVQVQDADINITDSTSYGDGTAGGVIAGITALNNAGQYHFARVTAVGATITFTPAIPAGVSFRTAAAASAANGRRAYEVVRVPYARNITVSGTLRALAWDGSTGGVVAVEAGQDLTLSAGVNVNAVGFRGAGGYESGSNPAGTPGTDAGTVAATSYAGSLTAGTTRGRGGKAEGIVGTPRLLDNRPTATLLYGYTTIDLGAANQGYPFTGGFGDFAWGAPGNAGGGGKQHDAGGGGGANAGAGGKGGGAYTNGSDHGGYGGAAIAGTRMFFGGGGGGANGWHPNNGSILGGGGRGGGMVFLRADTVTGAATINTDGQVGYGVLTGFGGPGGTQLDNTNLRGLGGDGGAAGGSVLLVAGSSTLATITVNARGANGGNTGHVGTNRSGAGGGGGGGRVLSFSPVAGPASVLTAGTAGAQLTTDAAPLTLPAAGQPSGGAAGTAATLAAVPGSACAEPDLTLAKTFTGNVVPGQTGATYSIVVTNSGSGPKAAGNTVTVTDAMPAGLTATAIAGTGWTCTLATLTCTRTDKLDAGAAYPAITLTYSVASNAPNNTSGILTNNAATTLTGQTESSTTNNAATAPTPVTSAYKSVRVTNDADGSGLLNPTLGDTLTWSVFVANPVGAASVPAFQVTDALPSGVAISATGAQTITVVNGTCTAPAANAAYNGAGTNALIAAAQTLAADCTIRIDIPTIVTGTGLQSNQPTVSGTGLTSFTSDALDNTTPAAGVPTGVGAPANSLPQVQAAATRDPTLTTIPARPTISKAFGPAIILAGGTSTLTITVGNPNAAAIGVVAVTDTFPTTPATGLVRAATPNASTTCSGGAVTSTAGSVTLTGGSVPAGGTCTFQIDVSAALDGSYVNTIAAGALSTTAGTNVAPASATLTVNPNADLAITKSDGGASVVPGTNVTYTLAVTNNGPSTASGVSVTDTIPAGLTFVSATGTGWACGQAAGVVTCTRATLATGAAPTITLVLGVPSGYAGANPIANATSVATTTNDPVAGNNTGSDTTPVAAAQADLAIAKDDGGSSAVLGGTITYTLSVNNLGPSDAAGLSVTDTIPAGLTFGSATGTGWACGQAAGVVTCTRASLASGATAPAITLVLNVPSNYAGANPIPNSAAIAATTTDPVAGNNTGSDTTPVLAPPDLSLTKGDGGATVVPGGALAYTLNYANASTTGATGVVITETVPANTTFNPGASTAGWACAPDNNAGSTCTLAIGNVAGGANGSATFALTVATSLPAGVTAIANSASVADDGTRGPDPTPGDNTGTDTTPVNATPDLSITKSDGGASATPGATVAYTLNYANNGNQGAAGVVLTDTVPANTTFNPGASSAGWTCAPDNNAGSTCTLAIGALAAGAGGTATFAVTVAATLPAGVTQVANTATVADDGNNGADPTPANNSGSDTTPLNAAPDLALTKSDGGGSVAPGGTVAYTLSYANNGNQGATGVALSETVPANTTFNPGASTAGWTCAPDNNAGSTCTLAIGALAAGAGGTATFAVTVAATLPAGVTQIANSATVADDGNNGTDPTPGDNTGNDNTPVTGAPDLSIIKSDGGATTTAGGTVTYTLNYANTGNRGASGVTVTETVPANTTFNPGASTAGWTCAPDNNAGSTCTLAVGTLAAGANGSATFALNVSATVPAGVTQISNTTSIADDGNNGTDPTPADNTGSDTTPLSATPDLAVTKSDGGASTTPGGTVAYTLNFANNGTQGASGVVLTETVPANTTFNAGASSAGWTCAPDNTAGSTCTLTIGGVIAGANGSRTFAVTVSASVPAGTTQIANSVTIADDGNNGADPTPADNTGSDTTPLNATPDLAIAKSDGGASVVPGTTVSYTLSYVNNGNQGATGVVLTDTVPANTTFNPGASGAGWTCAPDNSAGSTCTLAVGSVAAGAGGSATFSVDVASTLPGGVTLIANTATVADDGNNGADPTPGDNTGSDTTPIAAAQADLSLAKSDGGASVTPGNNLTYTLSVANLGPSGATGVSVSDTIPAGLTFVSATGTGWACGQAAGVVTCTRAALAVGAAPDITLVLGVPAGYAGANPIANSAAVASTSTDPVPGNDTGSDTTPVNAPSADLAIVKDDGGASVTPGANISYTLAVTNNGPSIAAAVSVTDTIPAGLTFVSATGTGWACGQAAGVVTCTRATLAVGAAPDITLVLGVPSNYAGANPIANSADVATTTNDPVVGNNTDGDTTPVNAASADLSIVKDDGGATVVPGNNVTYTLAVINNGPSDATGVSVSDTIPAGLTFVSATGTGWACGQAAGVVTCTRATLAVGAAPVITLVLGVPSNYAGANPIVNSTTVTSTSTDPTPGNDTDGDTTPVGAATADLSIVKDDGGATVVPGNNVTYTLAVTNNGPSDATGVSVSDTIPAGLTFVSATGTGWACGQAAGVVTCTRAALGVGAAPDITLVLGVPAGYAGANPIANSAAVASTSTDPVPGNDTGSDTTPVNAPSADLAIVKDDGGASVTPGANISYTLAVTNNGPSIAAAVSVTDTIPAGLTFVSATGTGWACGQAAGVVTCTRATLAVGAAPDITLVLGVPSNYAGANPIANSADVATTTNDPVVGNNTDGDTTPVGAATADLSIVKDDGGATVVPGNNVTYTLAVTNNGPSDATGVSVSDTIPAGLTFVSATGTGWACGQAAGVVTCTRATLAVGAAPVITLVLGVPSNYAGANPIVNSTTVTSTSTDPTPGNDTDGDTTPVGAATADLSIVKDDGGATVVPGNNVSYTLSVTNNGPSDATGVSVGDAIPAGLTFVSASGTGWACGQAAGVVTCTRATLAVGAAPVITLVLGVPSGYAGANPIVNSATVTSTSTDPTPGNDTDGDTTPVGTGSADLSIIKDDGGATVVPGNNVTYTLSVANAGASDAVNVSVSDTIPAGLTFVSATGTGWVCNQAAGVVTCTRATLVVGAAPDITLVLGVPSGYAGANPILNTSNVNSATPDPTPANNTDDDLTPVGAASADLAIVKDDGGATVAPGGSVTYTLAVANNGPSDAIGVSVSDTIPAGLTFGSASGTGWTCNQAAGVVTCTRATLAIGAAPAITLVLGVPAGYAGANPIVNSSTVTGTSTDPVPGNDTDGDTTPVGAAVADLSLTKAVDNATPVVGANVVFTLTLANAGPSDANSVQVLDLLPSGYTVAGAVPSQGTYVAATGVWNVGTLANGANATLAVTATVLGSGTYANTAQVSTSSASDPDSTPGNNNPAEDDQDTATVTPGFTPRIGVAKLAGATTPNGDGTYSVPITLTISNYGNEALNGVAVVDALATASGGSFGVYTAAVPASAGQYTVGALTATGLTVNAAYTGSAGGTTIATGSLAVGASASTAFVLRFFPQGTGPFMNQATANGTGAISGTPTTDLSDNGTDPDPDGDGDPNEPIENDPTPITVPGTVALTLDKQTPTPNFELVGDTIAYTYLVGNSGATALAGPVTVSDNRIAAVTCPALTTVGNNDTNLDPGESITCSANYTVVAADVTAGSVTNIATASAGGSTSNADSVTVPARRIALALTPVCVQDTPYVDYVVTASGFTPGANPVTITWTRNDGSNVVASVLPGQPMSGRLLWPGTILGPGGTPVDWPGWRFVNGAWFADNDGLRPTMQVTASVNPTFTQVVNYPPASAACNPNPTQITGPINQTQGIPATSRWSQLLMALALLAIGAASARRRLT